MCQRLVVFHYICLSPPCLLPSQVNLSSEKLCEISDNHAASYRMPCCCSWMCRGFRLPHGTSATLPVEADDCLVFWVFLLSLLVGNVVKHRCCYSRCQ